MGPQMEVTYANCAKMLSLFGLTMDNVVQEGVCVHDMKAAFASVLPLTGVDLPMLDNKEASMWLASTWGRGVSVGFAPAVLACARPDASMARAERREAMTPHGSTRPSEVRRGHRTLQDPAA